jgi:membrane protease subunit HflC
MSINPKFISSETSSRIWRRGAIASGFAVLALFACSSVIFVDETEFVIVERLGRIVAVYDRVDARRSDRGSHFKLPWPIATVRRFDRRQQLFDPPGREIFTRDKKNLTVSSYLCWKIADPPEIELPLAERPVVKFFRGLGNMVTAEARLEARIRSALEVELGQVELTELLRVGTGEGGPAGKSPLKKIAEVALSKLNRAEGGEGLRERLGIELVDFRIKRINLPEGNRLAVYERMRTERERIAERYRSAGLAEKSRIESQARLQSDQLLARAEADAERIKGEGEAEAIRLLNHAHMQDPEFYEFQRTLTTYSKVLSERTTLVLSSGSRLFKLLTEGVPGPIAKGLIEKGPIAEGPIADSPVADGPVPHGPRGKEPAMKENAPDRQPPAGPDTAVKAAPLDRTAGDAPSDRTGGAP